GAVEERDLVETWHVARMRRRVDVEVIVLDVVCHEDVETSRLVEVGDQNAQARSIGSIDTGDASHVDKGAVPAVEEQSVWLAHEGTWATRPLDVSVAADQFVDVLAFDVVDVEEVGQSVTVQVGHGGADGPGLGHRS